LGMLSFSEALEEDRYPSVHSRDRWDDERDLYDGWDVDLFPEAELRPETRMFAGAPPDVRINCRDGHMLLVHRTVLTEVSYFESLFNGQFCERGSGSLDVDEDFKVFHEVVRWIYCHDAACADKDLALDIFRLAEFYGIEGLIEHCTRALAALGILGPELAQHVSSRNRGKASAESATPSGAAVHQTTSEAVQTPSLDDSIGNSGVREHMETERTPPVTSQNSPSIEAVVEHADGINREGNSQSVRQPKAKDL